MRKAGNGGVPARRAVIRWAWRLLRHEWRQQLLILALITVAVAATFVGSAVATNTPPAPGAGFGTAADMATLGPGPHRSAQIAALAHRFGRVNVIENETFSVPGWNPLDEFALVPPGRVSAPTQVTVLFDAPGVDSRALGRDVTSRQSGRRHGRRVHRRHRLLPDQPAGPPVLADQHPGGQPAPHPRRYATRGRARWLAAAVRAERDRPPP